MTRDEQRAREFVKEYDGRMLQEKLTALLARRALEARKEALEEAAQLADKECWPYHSVFADKIRSLAAAGGGQ